MPEEKAFLPLLLRLKLYKDFIQKNVHMYKFLQKHVHIYVCIVYTIHTYRFIHRTSIYHFIQNIFNESSKEYTIHQLKMNRE